MTVVWRGYGLFVMIVAVAIAFGLSQYALKSLPMVTLGEENELKIAMLLSAAFIWFVGARLNSGKNHHIFLFLPVQWIGAVLTFLMVIYALLGVVIKILA